MKIAILHEMLIKLGGAEKVVESLLEIFPNADLYTLIYDEKKVGSIFPKNRIHPSVFLLPSQKIYKIFGRQKLCLTKMAESVESLDFGNYDRVIISSSGFAHGAITKTECKTIVYYHAPARYLWDWTHEYRKELGFHKGIIGYFFGKILKNQREWDYIAGQRGDILLANSQTTQSRIRKYLRRESDIVFPPIDIERFQKKIDFDAIIKKEIAYEHCFPSSLGIRENKEYIFGDIIPQKKYYVIISALTEFKRIDVAIKEFKKIPHIHLVIIGEGVQRKELVTLCDSASNIFFIGALYGDTLVTLVQNSQGLIFPGEEDFGIVPIEVMAAGKPVFALRRGGLTETVKPGETGEFFDEIEGNDFLKKFLRFHERNISNTYSSENCKNRAALFGKNIFQEKIRKYTQ